METKKFLLASAAATGVLAAGGVAWYGLLRGFYKSQSLRGSHRKSPSLGVDLLARTIYGIGLAAAVPRSRSNAESPAGSGFRTGILTGALVSIPSSLSEYGGNRTSLPAALATIGFETLLCAAAGAAVGKIYGEIQPAVEESTAPYGEFDREPTEGPREESEPAPVLEPHNGLLHRSRRV